MIESIHFKNVKALRDATLPLEPVTVLLGPNGSGKSTVLRSLLWLQHKRGQDRSNLTGSLPDPVLSLDSNEDGEVYVKLKGLADKGYLFISPATTVVAHRPQQLTDSQYPTYQLYDFSANLGTIGAPAQLEAGDSLTSGGENLVSVLQAIKDRQDEAEDDSYDRLNESLQCWLPEFDRVLLRTSQKGREVWLKPRGSNEALPLSSLSAGSQLALCLLLTAYQPSPPQLVGLEEPDRGLHPRLLSLLRDAIYRLAYPKEHGEDREPTQVILTTHNPYFVDEFKENPEQVVLAKKVGLDVTFERLSDQPGLQEMLYDVSLGEAWYTGFLGGVPAAQ